ncbi:MAG TPA: hypothetical protein V6C90_01670, partial [Coleofasciculaceae cyanobacterium]
LFGKKRDNTDLALIKAAGIVSVSALLIAAGLALKKQIVEAKIAMGISLGATSTALLTTQLRR